MWIIQSRTRHMSTSVWAQIILWGLGEVIGKLKFLFAHRGLNFPNKVCYLTHPHGTVWLSVCQQWIFPAHYFYSPCPSLFCSVYPLDKGQRLWTEKKKLHWLWKQWGKQEVFQISKLVHFCVTADVRVKAVHFSQSSISKSDFLLVFIWAREMLEWC